MADGKAPKIRSLPGQVFALTAEDLQELKLRQQALMLIKANYLLAQAGYTQHVADLFAKHGIDTSAVPKGQKWAINLDSGEISKQPISAGV